MTNVEHQEIFIAEFNQWVARLNLSEEKRAEINRFGKSFERNLTALTDSIARKTGQSSEDYYQEGICLLLEFMSSLKLEKLETNKLSPFFYKFIHDKLYNYYRSTYYKHSKHNCSADVMVDSETGLIETLEDLDPATKPEKCLLNKETVKRYKALAPLIRESLQTLPAAEQSFLNAAIFKLKSIKELAQEINLPLRKAYRYRDKLLAKVRQSVCLKLLLQPELKRKILAA
jgi:RNA polymerase sigma factor (sigma-70 family)